METTTKPLKRSEELAAFSREHHEDLLFTWKIRQGVSYGINPERMVAYCLWFWLYHLKDHFEREESLFAGILPGNNPMLLKMLDDHEAIRMKLDQLTENPCASEFQRLAQIIYYHVRFEERQLFQYVQDIATPQQKADMLVRSVKSHNSIPNWNDPFWIPSKN